MKKVIFILASFLLLLACARNSQDSLEGGVSGLNSSSVHSAGKTLRNYQNLPMFTYGDNTYVLNSNGTISKYIGQVWIMDISVNNLNCKYDIDEMSGNMTISHENNIDKIYVKNITNIGADNFTFDIMTSENVTFNNIHFNKMNPWKEILVMLVGFVIDQIGSSEQSSGGTLQQCQQSLALCPNGGMMEFTTTSGLFGPSTSCSVVCYK